MRRTNNRRSDELTHQLLLDNANAYYDIHGRYPEGSGRVEPIASEDQFYSDYTDSVAQERNRGARLFLDDRINKQIAALSPEDRALIEDTRDEALIHNTTGMTLGKANKSGKKSLKKIEHIQSYPDEALAIDLENALKFQRYADTTDPRLLDNDERELLMTQENTRFAPEMDNPVMIAVQDAISRQLNGGAYTGLGNAATSNSGPRERFRKKSKGEELADAQNLIAQRVMGRSSRTGAQTDGRGTDVEHIIAANVLPEFNNEGRNKYPGPKYLNRAYGDAVGAEQDQRVINHINELNTLMMAMNNPELVAAVVKKVPEVFSEYGKKPRTILKGIDARYTDKFSRFGTADMFSDQVARADNRNTIINADNVDIAGDAYIGS